MNPYIVFSAVLGLGLRGIKNKIELTRPPISTKGLKDGSSASEVRLLCTLTVTSTGRLTSPLYREQIKLERLPKNLLAATEKFMAPTSLAREVLGDDFVEHYGATRVSLDPPLFRFRLSAPS